MRHIPLKLSDVEFAMLAERSKKKKKKMTDYLMELVISDYNNGK